MTWIPLAAAAVPGVLALVVQSLRWWRNRPLADAKAAEVLTNTATGLLDRMQDRIDTLEAELRAAETEIAELRGRLDEAKEHAQEVGRLREQLDAVKHENVRLRSMLPERFDDEGA